MRSWTSFCDEVKQLASYQYEWPDGISHNIQIALNAFDQLCLNRLGDLLSLPLADDEKEYRLRLFFIMRWEGVINTSLDYTLNPQLPTNQLFLRIAKQIVKPEEAVCSVLMPTIQKVVGSDLPDDIKYASEDSSGEFHPHYFLTNADGKALLSLETIFSYAIQDTDFLFPALTESDNIEKKCQFDLSAEDRERIRLVSAETTTLFDYLQENHRICYEQKPSVGYALKILQLALFKSSKIATGSDAAANSNECQHPINAFYEIWRALSSDIKNQIEAYKVNGSMITLKDYLFCLFAHTPSIALSADEFDCVRGDMVACTHMISMQLDIILKQHVDLNNIPLPGMESQFSTAQVHDPDVLNVSFQNHVRMLKNPRIMMGENNRHLAARHRIFFGLTQHALDPSLFKHSIEAVSIRSMSDFMICFNMIPKENWPVFLSILDDQFDIGYFDFVVLLKELNPKEWNRFFALIFARNLGAQLDASSIAKILSEIPESQHALFVQSIGRYVDSIFSDSVDIFCLLAGTEIHLWLLVIGYFQCKINSILRKPNEVIQLFNILPSEDWLSLYALFQTVVRTHLATPGFFEMMYKRCATEDRQAAILSVVSDDVDWMVAHPLLLINVLKHLDIAEWKTIFSLFSPAHFRELIETSLDLFMFLNHFEDDDLRCAVIYHLREKLASMTISPLALCRLIETFPGCQNPLISVFRNQLPTIFSLFLTDLQNDAHAEYCAAKRKFLFLSRRSLPLLLSCRMIAEQCESFRQYHDDFAEITPDSVHRLYRQLRTIEKKMRLQEISREAASIEKLKLLSDYIKFSKTMGRTKTLFYRELVAFYGENFFDNMLKHCDALLQVHGSGLFSSNATLSQTHTVSFIRSAHAPAQSRQRASSLPVQSLQRFFVQGLRVQLEPRRSLHL